MNTIETGLPFFDDIDKQTREKSYFNGYSKEWICSNEYILPFQINLPATQPTPVVFKLVDVDTGDETDYLAYLLANAPYVNMGDYGYNIVHSGSVPTSLGEGRYYFYLLADDTSVRYSEVFTVRNLSITANPSMIEFRTIEIGLPFFDNIDKQASKSPYYNSHIKEWLSANNRFLPFQISLGSSSSGILTFNLVNSITGSVTDYKAYFIANTIVDLVDGEYVYSHLGLTDVTVSNGRYYFYAVSVSGRKWWSEEFVMCSNLTEETDYLLISPNDYLLIDGTDKLIIG